ncbi:tannase and feruloyl esterase, partial [Aulographum hederae CBS 113979]
AESVNRPGTFGQGAADLAYPVNAEALPNSCAIVVNATNFNGTDSTFSFGLFLPDFWNQRFLTVGNGGFGGGINWPDMGAAAQYDLAVMSSDLGHNGMSTDVGQLTDARKLRDWSYRALHSSIGLAKTIVTETYGMAPKSSFFSSCSDGGRQGMLEAQNYPEDFDGIMVGAPPWWETHEAAWLLKTKTENRPVGADYHIPDGFFPVIHAEVIKQCDSVGDGVVDGVISAPWKCRFRPEALLCDPSKAPFTCLNNAQINTLKEIYSMYYEVNGSPPVNATFVYPALEVGSELQWNTIYGRTYGPRLADILSQFPLVWNAVSSHYVTPLEDWAKQFRMDASSYDLSAFQKRGGKLFHFHGLADQIIPPRASIYYYQEVERTMQAQGIDINSFYRLFLIPGMAHCAGPGNKPWYIAGGNQACFVRRQAPCPYSVPGYENAQYDALIALVRWVENDEPINEIIASAFSDPANFTVGPQRKVCAYPSTAAYNGKGDVGSPASWYC